jgi:hypothetical protein
LFTPFSLLFRTLHTSSLRERVAWCLPLILTLTLTLNTHTHTHTHTHQRHTKDAL